MAPQPAIAPSPTTTLMARVLSVQGHARSRADTAATLRAEGHEALGGGVGRRRRAPACCRSPARTGDTVARLEAEAFLLVLPGTELDAAW